MRDAVGSIFRTFSGELLPAALIRHGLRRATFPRGEGFGAMHRRAGDQGSALHWKLVEIRVLTRDVD